MNTERLRQVQESIRTHPLKFSMNQWAKGVLVAANPECGTTACIAGWVLAHHFDHINGSAYAEPLAVPTYAKYILGITDDQADDLFFYQHWPFEFSERFERADNPWDEAAIAVEYIDYFIAQNGGDSA